MSTAGAVFGLLAVLLVPAIGLARHLAPRRPLLTRVLIGLTLAPLAGCLPALGLAALTRMPLATAISLITFVWVVVAGLELSKKSDTEPREGTNPGAWSAVVAILAVVLVALPPLLIPFVRYWSDAWFHAAAAIEIAERGFPPHDPNFAGIPFYYPWFFHGMLAILMRVSGLSPFALQMVFNVWAAAVLVLGAAHLGSLMAGRGAAAWAGAIALLGLNPFGWAMWLARGLVGDDHDLGRFWQELGSTNGAMSRLAFGGFPDVQASLLNRFWTGTALTPAIAVSLALAWSVADALERPGRGAWLRTFLIGCALVAFHPAYGVMVIAACMVGLVASLKFGMRRVALTGMGVLCAVVVVAIPYVRACTIPGTQNALQLGVYLPNLWSIAAAMGPWWLFALFGMEPARRSGVAGSFVLATLSGAIMMALFLILPERNSEKIAYLVWTLLAPVAAAGVAVRRERGRKLRPLAVPIALLLMLPTSFLFVSGILRENRSPGVLFRDDYLNPSARAMPLVTPDEAAAYRDVSTITPKNAVVIERRHLIVNESMPVLAGRAAFCGSIDVYLANHFGGVPWGLQLETEDLPGIRNLRAFWSEPGTGFVIPHRAVLDPPDSPAYRALREEFLVRRGIQFALFRDGGGLTVQQTAYLDHFGAPIYMSLRSWEEPVQMWDRFENDPLWGHLVHGKDIRVYFWKGNVREAVQLVK
jgi:hypothetical protein